MGGMLTSPPSPRPPRADFFYDVVNVKETGWFAIKGFADSGRAAFAGFLLMSILNLVGCWVVGLEDVCHICEAVSEAKARALVKAKEEARHLAKQQKLLAGM